MNFIGVFSLLILASVSRADAPAVAPAGQTLGVAPGQALGSAPGQVSGSAPGQALGSAPVQAAAPGQVAAPVQAPAKVAAPVQSEAVPETTYHLTNLRPVSTSVYPTAGKDLLRHYLQLRNQDGSHFIVYEEDSTLPAVKEVTALREAMRGTAACALEIACFKKAFCTGKCNNMYYQISNLGKGIDDGSRCRLISFTCSSGQRNASAEAAESK